MVFFLFCSKDEDGEYVGLATLPNQVQRKSVKKGFEFTLMVVGESGLGKSTLINSLFLRDLYKDRTLYEVQEKVYQTVAITKKTVDIVEKDIKLKLNIVDTPGFGDAMDNTKSCKAVVDYIVCQFEQYRRGEVRLNRKNIQDNRVHCCLYFISPFGHGLRPIDVEFMKALHEKVNIVPVLAKADCFTHSELQYMKTRILNELNDYRIKIYQFPECDPDDDELFKKQHLEMKTRIPFAVIGSDTTVESNGKRLRARCYPWGAVEVENPAHCDFVHLRNMLVQTHMQDLKDMTEDSLYENYRIVCSLRSKMFVYYEDSALRTLHEQIKKQRTTEIFYTNVFGELQSAHIVSGGDKMDNEYRNKGVVLMLWLISVCIHEIHIQTGTLN
uniref:Septin n=1 Tax=Pygocentrus nattereri TaxID=42514 RepID=A0A3B4CE97_PYGNA